MDICGALLYLKNRLIEVELKLILLADDGVCWLSACSDPKYKRI